MNFKKTHILLIVLSVFLLISIGSVCAAENASDVDIQLADSEIDTPISNDVGDSIEPLEDENNDVNDDLIDDTTNDGNETEEKTDINIIPVNVENEYQSGNFTFRVVDAKDNTPIVGKEIEITGKQGNTSISWITVNNNTSYSINQNIKLTTDSNGIVTLVNKGFYPGILMVEDIYAPVGNYNLTLKGTGDLNGELVNQITIKAAEAKVTLTTFSEYVGTSKKITLYVKNSAGKGLSGVTVKFIMKDSNGKEVVYRNTETNATINTLTTDKNGKVELPANNLVAGTYTIQISDIDDNVNFSQFSGKITLSKKPVVIKTADVTVFYNSGNSNTVKIVDKASGKAVANAIVKVSLDGKTYYFVTDSKGIFRIVADLNVGKHKMTVSFDDNEARYKASSVTKYITVKKTSAKFSASSTTAYYKQGKYFNIKLVNSKTGKVVRYAKINVKVYVTSSKWYTYTGYTNSKGILKIKIDYNPGTYKVVVSNADTKNYAASNIKSSIKVIKSPTKLSPTQLKAKAKSNSYFKVKAINTKLNKVIAGVKLTIKVYTGNNYKTYTVTTKSNGIAQLNVKDIAAGTHKVVVSSANKYCPASSVTSKIIITK